MQYADDTLCLSVKSKSCLELNVTEDLNNLVQLFNQGNASKSNYTHGSLCYVEFGPAIILVDTTLKEVYIHQNVSEYTLIDMG